MPQWGDATVRRCQSSGGVSGCHNGGMPQCADAKVEAECTDATVGCAPVEAQPPCDKPPGSVPTAQE